VSDDLFFLAGDDGLIYFATDNAGHEQNIRNHCQEGCGGAV
jgi:cell division protein YceG involved in septum cleavage